LWWHKDFRISTIASCTVSTAGSLTVFTVGSLTVSITGSVVVSPLDTEAAGIASKEHTPNDPNMTGSITNVGFS